MPQHFKILSTGESQLRDSRQSPCRAIRRARAHRTQGTCVQS